MLESSEVEQRLALLQSQLERLSQNAEGSAPPIEQRLASMADEYAKHLNRWAATVDRHTRVVGQLEDYAAQWRDSGRQMRETTADQLQELVTTIELGWETLKGMQEAPIRELREQAASLTQASSAMADASQLDIHQRLNELSIALQSALIEIRTRLDRPDSQDASAPWPLEDVSRLHGQLREGARGDTQRQLVAADVDAEKVRHPFFEPVAGRSAFAGAAGSPVNWAGAAVLGLTIAATVAGVFSWQLQRQINASEERQRRSDLQTQAVLDATARQSEAARQAAAKELATARELTNRVQRIAAVLAAPDLIRFSLSGADGASGQALVSRSRGFVVSGSLVPPPRAKSTHQAWLLTPTTAVKMGPLAVEPDGTVTLAEQMPAIPRAIVGVMVTEEPVDGGDTPSVATILTSVRRARAIAEAESP